MDRAARGLTWDTKRRVADWLAEVNGSGQFDANDVTPAHLESYLTYLEALMAARPPEVAAADIGNLVMKSKWWGS